MQKNRRGRVPAILGGEPAFAALLPITQPTVPPAHRVLRRLAAVLGSGMLTNAGQVRELEALAQRLLQAPQAVAVNSCTSGLILVLRALKLTGEVIIPAFTFHATAHAALWNNLRPVFVDCDPHSYNLDPQAVARAVTSRTSAVLAVHIFGAPADISGLQRVCRRHRLKLIFDAAHGFGARYRGRALGGFGDAAVFSMSPTKLATGGEAGIVTTRDEALAQDVRVLRNYGDSGNNDCAVSGLCARLSEANAALAIESLRQLEPNVRRRQKLALRYRARLGKLPGLAFQVIANRDRSCFKDFSILIDPRKFGLNRDELAAALLAENITVRRYFHPPVHRQEAFRGAINFGKNLEHTDRVSSNILSLPLSSHTPAAHIDRISAALRAIHCAAADVRREL